MKRQRVVVIGGGYAGIQALQVMSKDPTCEVVLIDQHPYHYMQTEAYELIAHTAPLGQVGIDLSTLCTHYGVGFVHDGVISIDQESRHVVGKQGIYPYDYLLLAAGARTAFSPKCKGLREHAYGVKSLRRTLEFKQKFEQRLYQWMENEGEKEPITIVVGGGGTSGIEVAAEMAYYVQSFKEQMHLVETLVKIVMVFPEESVLYGMDPFFIREGSARLAQLGVEVISGAWIVAVDEHRVSLDTGVEIEHDFLIFTGGIVASTLTQTMDLPTNRIGQLLCDRQLRCAERLFVAGDIAYLEDSHQRPIPPTAQSAEQSGVIAAHNILASIHGRPLRAYVIQMRGMMIALGGSYAAVSMFGRIHVRGYLGYMIKMAIMRLYSFTLKRHSAQGYARRIKG